MLNPALYGARRRRNGIMMTLSLVATAIGLGWLVLILGALLWEGFSGLSLSVFTEMTPPPGAAGGLLNPIMGSLMLTVLAVVIGTPQNSMNGTVMNAPPADTSPQTTPISSAIASSAGVPGNVRPADGLRPSSSCVAPAYTMTAKAIASAR